MSAKLTDLIKNSLSRCRQLVNLLSFKNFVNLHKIPFLRTFVQFTFVYTEKVKDNYFNQNICITIALTYY